METTLRPMSTSQVLDKTFSMYREKFPLFVGVAMLPQVCLLIGRIGLLLAGFGPSTNPSMNPTEALAAAAATLVGALILLLMAFVCYAVASAASVYAVSCTHLGYSITVKQAYTQIRPYILNVLAVVLLLVMGTGVVLFLLFILIFIMAGAAGIAGRGGLAGSIGLLIVLLFGGAALVAALLYTSARFSLAIPACVLERLGPVAAIGRSLALSRGSALRLVLALFLTAAVYYGLSLVFSIPYIFAMMRMFTTKNFAGLTPYLMLQYVGEFIASSLASPLAAIAATLIYYDERVRKEAFDLQWMMVLMGGQPAQPQPTSQEPPSPEGPAVNPPALG